MIVINGRGFGDDLFARWHAREIARCPGHIWHRAPHDPEWRCTRCPAWGRIK